MTGIFTAMDRLSQAGVQQQLVCCVQHPFVALHAALHPSLNCSSCVSLFLHSCAAVLRLVRHFVLVFMFVWLLCNVGLRFVAVLLHCYSTLVESAVLHCSKDMEAPHGFSCFVAVVGRHKAHKHV